MTCCGRVTEYQQRTDTKCTLYKIALQRLPSGTDIKPELALTYSSYYLHEVYVAHEQLTTTQSACTQIRLTLHRQTTSAAGMLATTGMNWRYNNKTVTELKAGSWTQRKAMRLSPGII